LQDEEETSMDYTNTQHALVAVFPDRASADSARQELMRNGFQSGQVEVSSTDDLATRVGSGNAGLSGTHHDTSGGGIAGWFHRMFGSDTDDDDRNYYSEAARRGGAAVVVNADDESLDRAADILNRSGAINVEDRDASTSQTDYRKSSPSGDIPAVSRGNTGTSESMRGNAGSGESIRGNTGANESIPVVEQELQVGKRAVQRGAVRVYSRVMQQPVEEQVNLREERVRVDRRAVDRPATEADLQAADREVIEVTETVEEPVVSKRSRVVEEVVVGKEVNERTETVRDNVLRSEVHVEDSRGNRQGETGGTNAGANLGSSAGSNYGAGNTGNYDTDYRSDFQTRYGSDPNLRYEDYSPAYQYGSQMASDTRYQGRSFDDVSDQLRTDYLRNNPNSSWDRMKGAVRYGWEKVTGKR